MGQIIELETERLRLRQWRDSDFPIFAKINADPDVMKYFPARLTEEESNKMAKRIMSLIAERGWGFWAVERQKDNNFIGFVGLYETSYKLPFTPCVEIGWRLGKEYWRNGYATEAAKIALRFAFEDLSLLKVYSFTPVDNMRSRSVMERLHMTNTNQNFNHPEVPLGNPLREHVLYELTKQKWVASAI